MDTKNHEKKEKKKSILILQQVKFCFQNTW
jgi:hypothetical protein